jgi:hypothetical protein
MGVGKRKQGEQEKDSKFASMLFNVKYSGTLPVLHIWWQKLRRSRPHNGF